MNYLIVQSLAEGSARLPSLLPHSLPACGLSPVGLELPELPRQGSPRGLCLPGPPLYLRVNADGADGGDLEVVTLEKREKGS